MGGAREQVDPMPRRAAAHTDIQRKFESFSRDAEAKCMWETCAVELKVRLPQPLAAEVEEVQRRDPDMLSRMLFYAMARRTIFDQLAAAGAGGVDARNLDEAEGGTLR